MDRLGALGAFVQAAETGSFTKAGARMGVSSSAIGKAVARLEDRIGVRLLHRTTRSITLTPEGALFLDRCRRIFAEVEAAELELAQTRAVPRGRLRISMPLASMLMMPTISAFMRTYPEIELDLDFSDRLVDVVGEGFDGVVRAGGPRDSRLMARRLGNFRFMLVAAPSYLAERGVPERPDDLVHHACLHHRFATSGILEPWPLRAPDTNDLPRTVVVNTIEPIIRLAEEGHGIACLPDFAIRRQRKAGTLVAVLDAFVEREGAFHLLWPSSRHLSPKLRVFVDFVATRTFDHSRDRRLRIP